MNKGIEITSKSKKLETEKKEFLKFGIEEKDILLELSSTITDTQVQSWIEEKYKNGFLILLNLHW